MISQFIYTSVYNTQVANVIDNLSKIADKKVEQVNIYAMERLNDAVILINSAKIDFVKNSIIYLMIRFNLLITIFLNLELNQ